MVRPTMRGVMIIIPLSRSCLVLPPSPRWVAILVAFVLTQLALMTIALHAADKPISGNLIIDGSSTVYPITVAIGEQYALSNSSVTIEVLCSGSSAGIRRLISGEVPLCGSSRPMKPEEIASAKNNGIDIIELPIAFDGLSVVINKRNDFIDFLTVAELKKIWQPDSTIKTWNQVRPQWPAIPIVLYGPGKDSGTFDYFTEAIVGKARASREDYTASEDDNDLVNGLVKNPGGLGYFGMSYLHENSTMLRGVPIDAGTGPINPTTETVADGTYRPLSRPLFLYVSKKAVHSHKEVRDFLNYYLKMVETAAPTVGYVALSAHAYDLVRERLASNISGSLFEKKTGSTRLIDLLEASRPQNATNATTATNSAAPTTTAAATNSPAPTTAATATTAVKKTNVNPAPAASPTTNRKAPAQTTPAPVIAAAPVAPVAQIAATKPVPTATTTPAKTDIPAADKTTEQMPAINDKSVAAPVVSTLPLPSTTGPSTRLDALPTSSRARIQDEALRLARTTLNNSTTTEELQQRLLLMANLIARENQMSDTPAKQSANDFQTLINRLDRNATGRTLVSDDAFTQFKNAVLAINDTQTRQDIWSALNDPASEKVQLFSDAITRSGAGDLQIVLCYARGGFILR
jgi:phosphate transport system substrate-binding protein